MSGIRKENGSRKISFILLFLLLKEIYEKGKKVKEGLDAINQWGKGIYAVQGDQMS